MSRSRPFDADFKWRTQDCIRDGNTPRVEGVAQRFEEPPRDHDPVQDREISGNRVARSGIPDDLHHDVVLLVGLGLPRLDVAGGDDLEEVVGLEVDSSVIS